MFFHYSVILLISKIKGKKPDQGNYNSLFFYIENNLRELGFGDVSVNKKMKDLNKIFYDILLKINISDKNFKVNKNIVLKYFENLNESNNEKYELFIQYFTKFYHFCFELSPETMIKDAIKFKV